MVHSTMQFSVQKGGIVLALSIAFLGSALNVHAEEIVISGNGSESVSQVSSTTNQTTTVQQSNTLSVENAVSTAAETGGNSADNNNGTVNLSTGDTSSSTSITNSGNTSSVQTNCCPSSSDFSVTISGNGTDSSNAVSLNTVNTTTVSVLNSATITNTLTGTAVTGRNSADDNAGNVSLTTGSITVLQEIKNGPLNLSDVNVPGGGASDVAVSIFGNGSGSQNDVSVDQQALQHIIVTNISKIFNTSSLDLVTGENSANGNVGSVDIATGDISVETVIENGPINVNTVTVTCCEKEKEKPAPPTGGVTPPPAPSQEKPQETPSGGGGGGGSSSGVGGSPMFAAVQGSLLPKTGGNWTLLFIFANLITLFLGIFIRLRSGRSPSFALATC